MAGFFEEIKRRKVYRAAVAYVVVAGGLIQLASAVFPAWELPNWALRLVIVLLLIGFPIALSLAWALEVTPEGIRTTPTPPTSPRRPRSRRRTSFAPGPAHRGDSKNQSCLGFNAWGSALHCPTQKAWRLELA